MEDLQNTVGYLDEVKQRYELKSDYALAKLLGCATQQISQYRHTGRTLGPEVAVKVAELLDLPPGLVLVCMEVERAKKSEVKTAWTEAANSMMKGVKTLAVAMLALVAVSFSPSPAQAASGQNFDSGTLYIMSSYVVKAIRRFFASLFDFMDEVALA